MLRIDDLMDQLHDTTVIFKIDLRIKSYQNLVKDGYVQKIAI